MSRKFGGSGLGLAICKQLAELMHGTVGVNSQPDQGSTFWCDIPCRVSGTNQSPPIDGSSVAGKEIWIIGPQQSSGWVMEQLLQEVCVKVVQVTSIQEVTALFEATTSGCHVAGIILSERPEEAAVQEWFERIRSASVFHNVKVWGQKPFWYRNDDEGKSFKCDGMITLPLHRQQFFQCVLGETVHGVQSDVPRTSERHPVERGSRLNESLESCRINEQEGPSVLVVEDNPVNQRVAAGMLGKLGCQVTIVGTGSQALTLLKNVEVDCIVMDWELPDMDGLAITQHIRDLEHNGGFVHSHAYWQRCHGLASPPVSHVPIIGMTAHVLPEHGQHCLESGMDDCLFKPVHLGDFERILTQWVGFVPRAVDATSSKTEEDEVQSRTSFATTKDPESGPQAGSHSECQVDKKLYDVSAALHAMEGDEGLLYSLLNIFNATTPDLIKGMHQAIDRQNRPELQKLAHQMKGALSAVHATFEGKQAEQLERMAVSATFSHLHATVIELEQKVRQLNGVFQRLVRF